MTDQTNPQTATRGAHAAQPNKPKSSTGHKAFTAIGVILCVIFIPILIINCTLLIKSATSPDAVPTVGGSAPLVVLTDSMYPEIQSGDLIIVSTTDAASVKAGDVISFFDPSSSGAAVVTHRVTEVTAQDGQPAWKTKGDANSAEDSTVVPASRLVGTYTGTRLAGLGNVAMFMQTPAGIVVCVIVPLIILIGYDAIRRRMLDKRNAAATASLQAELEELRARTTERRSSMGKARRTSKSMRAAMALLVATMLSTCMVGGTFAKYVTTANGSDTARVAKWGVTLQVDGSLYGTIYDTNNKPVASTVTDGISVQSYAASGATADKVVAPGTQSDAGLTLKLTGQPEVATALTATVVSQNIFLKQGEYGQMVLTDQVTAENFKTGTYYTKDANGVYTLATKWDDNNAGKYHTLENAVSLSADYYPVVYKSSSNTATPSTATDSASDAAAYIAKKLNGGSETVSGKYDKSTGKTTYTISSKAYGVNTDFASTLGLNAETITWAWAFENGEDSTETMYSGADIILGLLQSGNTVVKKQDDGTYKAPQAIADGKDADYCLDTSFSIGVTLAQTD